jgi:hypothetical protein
MALTHGGPGSNQYGTKPKKPGWSDDLAADAPTDDASEVADPMDDQPASSPARTHRKAAQVRLGLARQNLAKAPDGGPFGANDAQIVCNDLLVAHKDLLDANLALNTSVSQEAVMPDDPAGISDGNTPEDRWTDAGLYVDAADRRLAGKSGLTTQDKADRVASARVMLQRAIERLQPLTDKPAFPG